AHHRHAAGHAPQLSRARRRAGPLGLPLPPALPHGNRDDARSAGGGMSRLRASAAMARIALACALAAPATAFAQHRPHDPHAMHDDAVFGSLLFERLEAGGGIQAWDLEGWLGTDLRRAWLRSEGER